MTKLNNNIYGLSGLGVKNASWNNGFNGVPKQNGEGILKGSPCALQYCIKNQWVNTGKKVLGIKTMQKNGLCSTLSQRFIDLTGKEDKGLIGKGKTKDKDNTIIYNDIRNTLLTFKDVLNFGNAYTGKTGMSIRGVCQFTDGENKYKDTNIITEKILSPYANPNSSDPTQATNGTRCFTDEAHYVYDFTIFPKEYDKYIDDKFKGYQEEDYQDLKNNMLLAVSNYNSKAKAGCKNEFAMFIKVKENENYLLDLNCLQDYVSVYKEYNEEKEKYIIIYDLTLINDLLNNILDKIEDVEVYYNSRTISIKGLNIKQLIKKYDLLTRKEI